MQVKQSLIILFFVSVCYAGWNYDVTQFEHGACSPISHGCFNCITDNGQYLYRTLHYHNNGHVSYRNYSDSSCFGAYSEISAEKGACNTVSPSCEVFYESHFVGFKLSVRTFSPLSVSFYKEYNTGPTTIFELSATEVIAHSSDECRGIWFSAGGQRFRIINILSSTQYATNLGVMNIGQQYTINEFTFTLSKITSPTTPSSLPKGTAVTLYPFYEISVSPDAPDDFMVKCSNHNSFTWGVFLKDVGDLSYVNVGLEPVCNVTNMSLFPPYGGDDDDGTLVYKYVERSKFRATECHHYDASSSLEISVYECFFFSLSFSELFSWSGFSFGFDAEQQRQAPTTSDNMAFQLF